MTYEPPQNYPPTPPPDQYSDGTGRRRSVSTPLWKKPVVTGVAGLLIGGAIGAAAVSTKKDDKPNANANAATSSQSAAASSVPFTPEADPTPTPPPELSTSDFSIKLKLKSKECFGDAGCNVSYSVRLTYVGVGAVPDGSYEISYRVTGPSDGAQLGTVSLDNGQVEIPTEIASTDSSSTQLRAKITQVEALN